MWRYYFINRIVNTSSVFNFLNMSNGPITDKFILFSHRFFTIIGTTNNYQR